MELNDKNNKHIPYSYLVILLLVGACLALVGYQYHKNFEKQFRINLVNQFKSISDLKVGELVHWLEERRGDAETVFGNKVFAKYVKSYLNSPEDSSAEREIKIWMKEFQTGFKYDAVILTDSQLLKKIVIPEAEEPPVAYISSGNIDSLREGKLVFEDFYRDDQKQKIFLKILIPILDERLLIAVIELRIDPITYLYPILSYWPVPGETSEILILRHEGNEAVYLNELRFQKNAALNLRVSIKDTGIPAVRAVLGYHGFMEGEDYRGKAVVAYVSKVPNSPWFLVAKSDESEVYAPLRNDLWQTLIFGFVMFVSAGFGLAFLWRNQRSLFYKERSNSAEALRESEKIFRRLFDESTDPILLLNETGFTDCNQSTVSVLSYSSKAELLNKAPWELSPERQPDGLLSSEKAKAMIDKAISEGYNRFEWIHTKSDGSDLPVEVMLTPIQINGKQVLHTIWRDITERHKTDLDRQVIHEITHGVTTTDNLNELLKLIHQSLGKVLFADNIFVALYNQNTKLFNFPYWVDQFDTIPEPDAMRKSLSSYVFRTEKPILFTPELFELLHEQNEVELVGSYSPSWIGVPLHTPNRTIGVLVLQHYEKENIYSERDVQFLYSVGSQIAMIIDRKQAEDDLRKERLLLRTVIDNIPDSIYCKDNAYRKTLANLSELHYLGVKSETEIIGKTDFDLYPKELADGFFADDQWVIQTGRPVINREEFVIDKTGQKHWLLTSKHPTKDEFGNITGLVGIGRDITIRRQAEEDLRESEIKLNAILQSTADGILAVNANGKVIKTNRRFAELWQVPQSLIDSGKDDALISFVLDQLTNPDEFISKVQKLYYSIDEDMDFLHFKDGRTFERFSGPMVMDDSKIGRVWSFRDITSAKRAEEEIRKSNDELSKSNVEKDKFFSIIAHDLRSPFGSFIGLTEILVEELPVLQPAELMDLAETMRKSALNLFGLLNNLLEWARMRQGLISHSPNGIKLDLFVKESVEVLNETANRKGIHLSYAIPSDLQIFGDRNTLQSVIRNLVSNAVKFTPKCGKIHISARESESGNVIVGIKDSGIGMNKKMVGHLFNLDVKTNRQGTEGEASTGLGLLLCKEFVEKNGGKLGVESIEGVGSLFYFTIPLMTSQKINEG